MDARTQLRRYLEQRRELGETEFLLDNMSVEEALQVLGAIRRGSSSGMSSGAGRAQGFRGDRLTAPQVPVTRAVEATPPIVSPTPKVTLPPEALPTVQAVAPDDQESDDMKAIRGRVAADAGVQPTVSDASFKEFKSIGAIAKAVEVCTRCRLYKTATYAVPGEGNVKADLVCVGEAPGANEDATGRPFVGAAGQLLTKILAAIDIKREDVFICNVIKHRPPQNRNPLPDEIAACSPYLIRQIEIIRPKVILAFGTFAAQTLLATKTPIGKLRGQVHEYHGVPLVVTYHPAALLRNPAWKRPTWEDVKLARRVLDSTK
jgi:uracil-DNA glycosylase family 4